MDDPLSPLYQRLQGAQAHADRPFLTLSYAQSLDGSIAITAGAQTDISAPESLEMTHRLRAIHDGILVGIGTVLADDPQLTVRQVAGDNPTPIILDTHLRTPLNARIMYDKTPIIFHGSQAPIDRRAALRAQGAETIEIPLEREGRLDGQAALSCLHDLGFELVMVEGGAAVISYVLASALADMLILTIAPFLLGGLRALDAGTSRSGLPALGQLHWQPLGRDLIAWADLVKISP
ncbi:MAG: dihydrofolate reductase family protein [Anaerolineales bacterium]